ncbi:MAG: TIGR01777 family protein [Actinobacteria bacterium]|nr:TIGR01777 family protein [Actinomycetota bacterium]MDQ3218534.1 TIGR01777 family oxidoreductase [Actinomycetota bacterium]
MRILLSGASGFIGSALRRVLEQEGHEVSALSRSAPADSSAVQWDPDSGELDPVALEGWDAVVHLAGEGIGDRRWNEAHKRRVRDSRIKGTTLLSRTLAKLDRPPAVLLSASAIGYYGDRGDEALTENAPAGGGFLAGVVQAWEESTAPARDSGIRVVTMRSGLVLDGGGGVLKRQLIPFRLGMGGRLGAGRQYWSWITLEDEVRAMQHLLDADVSGAVNLTAPTPVTNAEFTAVLGRVLSRPAFLSVPPVALEVVLGKEMATEMLFFSQRVVPSKLEGSGFRFRHPELESALRAVLGK